MLVGCAYLVVAMHPAPTYGDTLPKSEAPAGPAVTINIQTRAVDPALQKLLTSHLTPSSFKIAGLQALPFDQVAALFAPLANRDTTVAELLQAANKVTQMYKEQERGYPLSFAFFQRRLSKTMWWSFRCDRGVREDGQG